MCRCGLVVPLMRVRVTVQARTDSTRLPAKALLPVGGMPSAVLAAKRAANAGHDVVLATTDRAVDDHLAGLSQKAGIRTFRGAAEDVRGRFLAAVADLDDDDVIVRLTADNLFPDGDLVGRAVDALVRKGALLVRSMADPRLPYGLAIEAMRAGSLRASVGWRDDAVAREHVTPALIDRAGSMPRLIDLGADLGALRCTMDTFEDYLQVARLFDHGEDVVDVVQVGWERLVARLVALPDSPPTRTPGPGLIIGTAQLGVPYGSVCATVPPVAEEARAIVCDAARSGYGIDTAPAYGPAESLIGQALRRGDGHGVRLTTKLDVGVAEASDDAAVDVLRAETSVLRSRLALGEVVPDVLVHRPGQRVACDGAVWQQLRSLQEQGMIGRLGVSVYHPEQALDAVADPSVQIVQLPFNLLDKRWLQMGVADAVRQREDVVVHARSVFLQGVLVRPPDSWPRICGVDPVALRARLQAVVGELGRVSLADLCVAYVRGHGLRHGWIGGIIVGIESMQQFRDTASLFGRAALSGEEIQFVDERVGEVPDQLLDPSAWPPVAR